MPEITLTDYQYEQLEALRDDIAEVQAGGYTSVRIGDAVDYLLDLEQSVEDPDYTLEINVRGRNADTADVGRHADGSDELAGPDNSETADSAEEFPRKEIKRRLRDRNLRYDDPESATDESLYALAQEYDIKGRSDKNKNELVEALLAELERLYQKLPAGVTITLEESADDSQNNSESQERSAEQSEKTGQPPADNDSCGATNQNDPTNHLENMMSLLDNHQDKWRQSDTDARYEVDLPDGSVETARTKDDVRAVLFRHY